MSPQSTVLGPSGVNIPNSIALIRLGRQLSEEEPNGAAAKIAEVVARQGRARPMVTPDTPAGERILAQFETTRVTAFGCARGRLTVSTTAL